MKRTLIILLSFFPFLGFSQDIKKGLTPPVLETYYPPSMFAEENEDFDVKVKQGNGDWKDLDEYKTYVQKGSNKETNIVSTFVQFDFSGTVDIKITCKSSNEIIKKQLIIKH